MLISKFTLKKLLRSKYFNFKICIDKSQAKRTV